MDKILLFIPMYNCEKQIVRVLRQLKPEICRYLAEAVIVNNQSTDQGEQAAENYLKMHQLEVPVRLLRNDENYGLGGSHKIAFQYALRNRFDYIIVLHGDDQGDISNILPYLKRKTYAKYDCFLGARFARKSRLQGYSKFRTFGNHVYNLLFSAATHRMVYDLGSGLNMYRVSILRDKFYEKYADGLMFNYCMMLGSSYYHHRIGYFPILWREDDQVSNVKMVHQAAEVLKVLAGYMINKRKFISAEYRDRIPAEYAARTVYFTDSKMKMDGI